MIRSYRNRLGRPPTFDELRAALGLVRDAPSRQSQSATGQAHQTPYATDVEDAESSYHNRFGRVPTTREIQFAVGEYPAPPATSPEPQGVESGEKSRSPGLTWDEIARASKFFEALRRLELERMRAGMGLESDRPARPSESPVQPSTLPPPTVFEEMVRKIFSPIQGLIDEWDKERMQRRMEQFRYHGGAPRG